MIKSRNNPIHHDTNKYIHNTYMRIYTYIRSYIHIYTYTYTHAYLYTYTHTYTYTYTLSYSGSMYRLGSEDILIGKYMEEYNLSFERKLSCSHLKQEKKTRPHIPQNEPLKSPNVHKILEISFFIIFRPLFL
jgi:hypothetical protein